MDIQQIRAFIAIAELGSFSLAAEQLHLTQPAISKRISLLEDQLSVLLFDRVGRQVLLTQAGQHLLPHARRILAEVDSATQSLLQLSGQISGTLSIATSHHIGVHYLPPYLRQYARRYPQVKLDLHFLDSDIAYKDIVNGRFDFALLTLPNDQDPKIFTKQLWQDELLVVAGPKHPLAKLKKVTIRDLSQYGAILPDPSTKTTSLLKTRFDREKLPLNIDMITNHLDAIKMLLSIGLGWGVLPKRLVDDNVTLLDLTIEPLYRPLGYAYHRQRHLNHATTAFLTMLEEPITNMAPSEAINATESTKDEIAS